jgi:hypothetical protein
MVTPRKQSREGQVHPGLRLSSHVEAELSKAKLMMLAQMWWNSGESMNRLF